MAVSTHNLNSVPTGTVVLVRGKIAFARLLTKIEGEELANVNARRQRNGQLPIAVPYTTVTLSDAKIVPKNKATGQLDEAELWVQDHFYRSNKDANDPNAPVNYSKENRSPFPNRFYQADNADGSHATEFTPTGEFATGLDVMLLMSVIKPKSAPNKGLGLDSIMVFGEPKYYQGTKETQYANAGITLVSNPAAATVPETPTSEAVSDPDPGENVFQSQPAAANDTWTCTTCHHVNDVTSQFCGQCGSQKPGVNEPIGNGNPYASGGIRP